MEFQLKDDAVKVLHSICQQIWKTQQWPQDWKRSVFISIPKKGNVKEFSNHGTITLILLASNLKIYQARLQQYVNRELPDVQAGFSKGRGTRDQIAYILWFIEETGVGSHFLFRRLFLIQGSEPPSPTLHRDSLPSEPPGIFPFQSEKHFKRLASGGSLALQFIYSVTRGGCVIWKQLSFRAIKERKFMLSIDVPQKSEKKKKDFHHL